MRFEDWIALAFPWLHRDGADYRNLRAALIAGYEAAKSERENQ